MILAINAEKSESAIRQYPMEVTMARMAGMLAAAIASMLVLGNNAFDYHE